MSRVKAKQERKEREMASGFIRRNMFGQGSKEPQSFQYEFGHYNSLAAFNA